MIDRGTRVAIRRGSAKQTLNTSSLMPVEKWTLCFLKPELRRIVICVFTFSLTPAPTS